MQHPARLTALIRHLKDHERHDPHDILVRQVVRLRARDGCEYCLQRTSGQFHVDHIVPSALWPDYAAGRLAPPVPLKSDRRGPDHIDNFAWCCAFCNVSKHQKVTHRVGKHAIRLFDPRYDVWSEHFTFMNSYLFIIGITPIGVATQRALEFNTGELNGPLGTRHDSILDGRYPPSWIAAMPR